MKKKLKTCSLCMPYRKTLIEDWRFCCKWHWGELTDDLRVGIIKLTGPAQRAKKQEAIKFLQGKKYDEKEREEQQETGIDSGLG